MTREQRLAAGWSLSGWGIRGVVNGEQTVWATWPQDGLSNPPIAARAQDRNIFSFRRAALKQAGEWPDNWGAKLVAIWRRKRVKP